MRRKIVLGILLPLLIIFILVSLSTSRVGFSVQQETEESVLWNTLFVNGSSRATILIQTINLENNYFLPRTYELPGLTACLWDREEMKTPVVLTVRYTQLNDVRYESPLIENIFSDYTNQPQCIIEIPAHVKKQIKIVLEPKDISFDTGSYEGYDEVVIAFNKENSYFDYNSCNNLVSEDITLALVIKK